MDNTTKEIQTKLLELMIDFHEVCNKHKINYYMLGGTMLGAVRHQGFIPWDDDMDVGIPREDYKKLLSLPQNAWPDYLHLKTPNNSKDLIFPYSKLMNRNTTLIEDRLDGIVGGVYIDVFPLDGAGNSFIEAKMRYYVFYWKLGLLYNNQDYGNKRTILRKLVQGYSRKQKVTKLFINAQKNMDRIEWDNNYIGNFAGAWGLKEFMPREYMGNPTLYKFEDSFFYGAEKADLYLKSLYGDYMQLPPIEKRISHHNLKYLDLETPYSKYQK
jgi:lipopolysaccharide cholinephosphotransferase